jgi:hypothetical protein
VIIGSASNAAVTAICIFFLTALTPDIKTKVINMFIRIRIPIKSLKTGVNTNKNNIDIRRKRNLSLKITCVNLELRYSAIIHILLAS